jgi:hypothetical protein
MNAYKGKASHNTPMEEQGERKYSFYSFITSALDGVSGQCHAPAKLYLWGKDPRYPLDRRQGGSQNRSEQEAIGKILFATAGDRTSIARSSSPQPDKLRPIISIPLTIWDNIVHFPENRRIIGKSAFEEFVALLMHKQNQAWNIKINTIHTTVLNTGINIIR